MTVEEFNTLVKQCSNEIPDFYKKAEWCLKESDEPGSVHVQVKLLMNLGIKAHHCDNIRIYLTGESMTQDSYECIKNAVTCLNEELLAKTI